MQKSFKEISLPITEEEYRADGCMHYSTLAKYERSGFHGLANLEDRIETPSLTNGSAVDSIITGGMSEFEERFFVADMPDISDNMQKIINALYVTYCEQHSSLDQIPEEALITAWDTYDKRTNWKATTKVSKILEEGAEFYKNKFLAGDRTLITTSDYNSVMQQVRALKESPSTKWFFQIDNPFDDIERIYQAKFKANFDGIDFSCMADLIVVDHNAKVVYPIDLKTSSHYEDEFYKSFIDWNYQIQARNYWRIIRDTMDRDPVFKHYSLANYRFIVVNKRTLTPLVWLFEDTKKEGTLVYGVRKDIVLRDPLVIAKELKSYMDNPSSVPLGINLTADNSIIEWLNKQ